VQSSATRDSRPCAARERNVAAADGRIAGGALAFGLMPKSCATVGRSTSGCEQNESFERDPRTSESLTLRRWRRRFRHLSVSIINYGMGNLRSVVNAVRAVGGTPQLVSRAEDLAAAERIILPGVGAFGEAMTRLRALGFVAALEQAVFDRKRPMLGICLGMQLLATRGYEHGQNDGLGWIAGEVRELAPAGGLRVPHMGWNTLQPRASSPLFTELPPQPDCYFVHSFQFVVADPASAIAEVDYGGAVVAVVAKDHIFGTQFHPEKSHRAGLALLRNFLRYAGEPC
jgi:glutamine amidotransferase